MWRNFVFVCFCFFFKICFKNNLEAHGCSFQVSDSLVLVFWIWVLRIFNESPYWLFSIALSRESLIIKLFKRRVSFRIERGREVGSTRWGGTPVTFGHKIGRNLLERKKRKAVIRNQPLLCPLLYWVQ